MKSILLLIALFSLTAKAQFGSETTKKIDTIENNTATDITINPTNKVVIPYLTSGELVIDAGTGLQSFANGTEGQLLSITSGVLDFIDPPASSPLTTKGDIYVYDVDNQRLPVGTNGQLLSADSVETTGLKWIDPPVTTPTTTEGDLILRGATEDIRLPIGTTDYLLTSDGTTASWQPAPVSTTLDTKGQIQTYSTENAALDVGVDGTFLVADSTEPTGLKYTASLQGKLNPVTDWVAYTPSITSFGTVSNVSFHYKRVGDSIKIKGYFTAGTTVGTIAEISLPSGLTYDTAKHDGVSNEITGKWIRTANDINNGGVVLMNTTRPNTMEFSESKVFGSASVAGLSSAIASTMIATSEGISLEASFPIQGWTSGLDAAVQDIQLTAATANSINLNVETISSGNQCNITSSQFDLTGFVSCTRNSTGNFLLDYTGLGLTHPAGITFGCEKNNCEFSDGTFPSLTAVNVIMVQNSTAADGEISITIHKHNNDVNKSQVIAGTFENIDSTDLCQVKAVRSSGGSITAGDPVDFTEEVKDNCNAWNGTIFTAPKSGRYSFSGTVSNSVSQTTLVYYKVNGVIPDGAYSGYNGASTSSHPYSNSVDLSEGDTFQLITDRSTDYNNSGQHHIYITQSADYEAIVKNLYADNVTECETKFLQADTAVAGNMADLQFTNVVGKKYLITGQHFSVPNAIIKATHGASNETISRTYENGSDTIDSIPLTYFTATQTVTNVAKENAFTTRGNGAKDETWVQMCKLPDTTIIN